jgi:hypothetical protein
MHEEAASGIIVAAVVRGCSYLFKNNVFSRIKSTGYVAGSYLVSIV